MGGEKGKARTGTKEAAQPQMHSSLHRERNYSELQPANSGIQLFSLHFRSRIPGSSENPDKKIQKKQDNHLEFKICLIQEEAVEDGGELVHCPEENPKEIKTSNKGDS